MYEYDNDSPVMSVDELMDALKIGKNLAYQLLGQGSIKAFRIGRVWKIPRSSLENFIVNSAQDRCQYLSEQ